MLLSSPANSCVKNILLIRGSAQRQMTKYINFSSDTSNSSCCLYMSRGLPKLRGSSRSFSITNCCSSFNGVQEFQGSFSKCMASSGSSQNGCLNISWVFQNMQVSVSIPERVAMPKIKFRTGSFSRSKGFASVGFIFGLACCSSSEPVHAEAPKANHEQESDCDSLSDRYSHGKKVYTDYSVTGIPGDGRCLFRSVAHGACLRTRRLIPNESQQRELADELREKVADEFVKRRKETEWFIEGDFDKYVLQIRKPHAWGGEPELLMASHVLQMPIIVYMYDQDSGGLISIAEYGLEYGKENPIKVLYHGYGHYDALQISGKKDSRSRL